VDIIINFDSNSTSFDLVLRNQKSQRLKTHQSFKSFFIQKSPISLQHSLKIFSKIHSDINFDSNSTSFDLVLRNQKSQDLKPTKVLSLFLSKNPPFPFSTPSKFFQKSIQNFQSHSTQNLEPIHLIIHQNF